MAPLVRKGDFLMQAECKLGDSSGGKVDVPSTWRASVRVTEGGAQTEVIEMSSNATQSCISEDAEVQTDNVHVSPTETNSSSAATGAASVFEATTSPIEGEESREAHSPAAAADTTVTLSLELRSPFISPATSSGPPSTSAVSDGFAGLVVTGIAWNATGNVVAVSYGRLDVRGWCHAPGALCTWNVGRRGTRGRGTRGKAPSGFGTDGTGTDALKPDTVIQLDNCLMAVAFHPTHPALIAGGTFNGEIYLWDLGREDPQRAKSRITDFSHREPITQLSWQYNTHDAFTHIGQEHAYQIVSTSTDGKVLVWSIAKLDDPVYGYELTHARQGQKELLWGATCLSLASSSDRDHQGAFVVGTEGGAVFRCLMRHNDVMVADLAQKVGTPVSPGDPSLKLKSPVRSEFVPHVGAVRAAACSPFQRNLFLTAGADGSLRIYSVLQAKPLLHLAPSQRALTAAQWSPFRPLVVATAAADGHVHFYDLQRSVLQPCKSVRVREKGLPVEAMAFNPKAPDRFAAADGSTLKIFSLGTSFQLARQSEASQIDRLEQQTNVTSQARIPPDVNLPSG